ncbi:DUF1073 domain-containing protein [Desulfovibrio sp. OttesenSCG-928-A18]|nr:DUF1073 domain-containing protein [Desulfovibrio sp. OttesenSCG-928-A18]
MRKKRKNTTGRSARKEVGHGAVMQVRHIADNLGYLPTGREIPTPAQIREQYGPPKSLGLPASEAENLSLAMDSALEGCGFYSLIQHAFEMGQGLGGGSFLGYGTLSRLCQNGLVSACVETVADDMTREWIDLSSDSKDGDAGNDDILISVKGAIKKFKLRDVFHRAVSLTQYFGGCLIFIDTGVNDPEMLKKPLDISNKSGELGPGRLRGFTVIEPVNVSPGHFNSTNPLSREYFEPGSWWVLGREIHASRFIKISTGDVPILLRPSYNFFGVPHAQILWDYVMHFQECRTASQRMLTKFSDMVFKTDIWNTIAQPGGAAEIDKRIGLMARNRSNDGIAVIDRENEDIVKLETPLGGVTDIVRQSLEMIAAINRTPAVKLLAISPAGFNATGESDIRNYYDHIASQQEKMLYSGVARALDCVQLHVVGKIEPGFGFNFRELGGEDRQIESGIRKANTDTLAALVMAEIVTASGAQATVEANPDEYLVGLVDGIKVDREEMEAGAEVGFEDDDDDESPENMSAMKEAQKTAPVGLGRTL